MENKEWKVEYKKLPDNTIHQFGLAVIAKTEEEARKITIMGVSLVNLRNMEVEKVEIVSCVEIKE